jgi:hypothetical protein
LNTTSRPSLNTRGGVDAEVMCAASLLFPLGAPIKVCTTCLRGLGGSVHCFVFDSETAYELVSHTKPHLPFGKCAAQQNTTAQSQLREILNLCKLRDGNVSFPSLRTIIQLPVVMP